jgi:hypothetical protein
MAGAASGSSCHMRPCACDCRRDLLRFEATQMLVGAAQGHAGFPCQLSDHAARIGGEGERDQREAADGVERARLRPADQLSRHAPRCACSQIHAYLHLLPSAHPPLRAALAGPQDTTVGAGSSGTRRADARTGVGRVGRRLPPSGSPDRVGQLSAHCQRGHFVVIGVIEPARRIPLAQGPP